ncbi:MAG: prolyl-tRNA synthetase associated domain-containing protein [Proteobacteria bacterium]|nr:prolyl-tRNA synthetase associated domain-containing protein [Pseudomonadota bacterium]
MASEPSQPAETSSAARERLFGRLTDLGITTSTVPYPAHRTVDEGKALRGDMAGTFTKNLLLRDKKKVLFMVVVEESRTIDLKALARAIGASGHLSFAAPDLMRQILGVEPGALTPFALINESDSGMRVVLDKVLFGAEQINFHPLVNTESTGIAPHGLLAFVRACRHEPLIVDFSAISG